MQDGKVAVDYDKCNYCGRCAKSCPTDAWDAPSAYIISFAGTFGNSISKGESPLPLIRTEEQLFRVCDAAIQFFADNAKPSERFKFTLDRVGREEFYKKIKEAYNEIDDTVDITDVVCPTTFVKAKVALEELDDGQILAVRMNDGEPVQNVPRSIKEEGHQILKLTANEDGTYTLIVRKVEDED